MYFRQIAVATAIYAMLALAVATARVPTLDAGIDDWHKESSPAYRFDPDVSAYSIEPDVIALREEDIIP